MDRNRKDRDAGAGGKRIMAETALLLVAEVAAYLLLRRTFLPAQVAAHSDLVACAILVLWTWPVYHLILRYRVHAEQPSQNPNESELQMLRAVIDSSARPDLL